MHARFVARNRQQGFALLEALIAALVVAAGAAALLWLQGELRHNADAARQRTEAARLAQADIERLRASLQSMPPRARRPGARSRMTCRT